MNTLKQISKTLAIAMMGLVQLSPVSASDSYSARTAAMGGAGHAAPLLNDAIFLNPSYASYLKNYALGLTWNPFDGGLRDTSWGREGYYGRNYSVSIQDGRSPLFQAGVAYTVKERGAFLNFGASKTIVQELGLGIGAKYFFPNSTRFQRFIDINFSTTWVAQPWLQVALMIDNLIASDSARAFGNEREFTLGTRVNVSGIVIAYIDPHYVPKLAPTDRRLGWEAGLELPALTDLYLRAGHFRHAAVPYQEQRGGGVSFGAGWIGPRISLDAAIQRVLESDVGLPDTTGYFLSTTMYF